MDPTPDAYPLFLEDGSPIHFFVDPAILARPKLIRTLKAFGASIASDPRTSDFILVQSEATTGQQFIRDWNAEKVVLEAAWVSRTIAAKRLLKESDQWGGCLAVADPDVKPEDLDQNTLPTPRITPVETATAPSTWPANVPPPHNYPTPDSRHSSQQPPGVNGQYGGPPAPFQQPGLPIQMPQFPPPPGMQQPFYSFQVPQLPTLPPIDPNVYSMIFMDVLTRLPGWPGASGLPNGMQNSFQNGMQNGMQPGFFPLMNHMPAQMQSQPPGLIPMAPDSLPSVSDPPTPSLSRGSSVDIKGKGKAKAASYVSRGSSGSSKPIFSSSASIDNFFTSDSGEPLTFYVAIEVNRRSELLNQIKRHGGQISTQTSADFAILTSRSKDYETLLETVISSNGTAVKPAFVQDCVAQNMLLEHFQYQFELPEKLLRKVKKVTPRSPAKTDAEKKQAANMRKAKSRKVKKDVDIKTERSSPGPSRPHIPSPSPPPEHTRVSLKGNTYRYPQVEDEYLLKYAAVLFARDQQMSYSALATKLHRKMPHHSEKGWNHHITQSMRDEIEKVRKRAIIAYRKEQHTLSQQSSVDAPPAKRAKLSTSADDGPKAQGVSLEDEEHDLNTVAHFFANGGDAEQPEGEEEQSVKDARVWASLTEQSPCRTESSWEIFYNKHHTRVMHLYELLVDGEDGPPE